MAYILITFAGYVGSARARAAITMFVQKYCNNMNETFIQNCIKAIQEDSERVADQIIAGGCKDFEDYRAKVSYIKGQNRAIEIISEEFNRYVAS